MQGLVLKALPSSSQKTAPASHCMLLCGYLQLLFHIPHNRRITSGEIFTKYCDVGKKTLFFFQVGRLYSYI